jgi:hypothetical protein
VNILWCCDEYYYYFRYYLFVVVFFLQTARLFELGLISLWQNWYEPNSKPCYDDRKNGGENKKKEKPLVRLSLTNLAGAFAVLAFGCVLSFLTFLGEMIIFHGKNNWTLRN